MKNHEPKSDLNPPESPSTSEPLPVTKTLRSKLIEPDEKKRAKYAREAKRLIRPGPPVPKPLFGNEESRREEYFRTVDNSLTRADALLAKAQTIEGKNRQSRIAEVGRDETNEFIVAAQKDQRKAAALALTKSTLEVEAALGRMADIDRLFRDHVTAIRRPKTLTEIAITLGQNLRKAAFSLERRVRRFSSGEKAAPKPAPLTEMARLEAAVNELTQQHDQQQAAFEQDVATANEWERRAMLAVKAGDDVLAKEALQVQKTHELRAHQIAQDARITGIVASEYKKLINVARKEHLPTHRKP